MLLFSFSKLGHWCSNYKQLLLYILYIKIKAIGGGAGQERYVELIWKNSSLCSKVFCFFSMYLLKLYNLNKFTMIYYDIFRRVHHTPTPLTKTSCSRNPQLIHTHSESYHNLKIANLGEFIITKTEKNIFLIFYVFYPAEFTPEWGIVVTLLVRTSKRTSNFFLRFLFFWFITVVVLDDFFIFWKNDLLGWPRPFFTIFLWYGSANLGRAASQVIYAGIVLFAYCESTKGYVRTFFSFFQKKPSSTLQIKLKIGD